MTDLPRRRLFLPRQNDIREDAVFSNCIMGLQFNHFRPLITPAVVSPHASLYMTNNGGERFISQKMNLPRFGRKQKEWGLI